MMKKLIFIFIFVSIILIPIQVSGEEKSDAKKTVLISIFDENGNALDLTNAMISLHSKKIYNETLMYNYTISNEHVTGQFTKDNISLEFSTVDDYDIKISLKDGCNVIIEDQLRVSTFDDETDLSYNVNDLAKVELGLGIEEYKNIDVRYEIKGKLLFSGKGAEMSFANKSNSSNYLYISPGKYDVIYQADINNKFIIYKQEINIENDGNYKSDISLDDLDKIICSYSDYYKDYSHVIIRNYVTDIYAERENAIRL